MALGLGELGEATGVNLVDNTTAESALVTECANEPAGTEVKMLDFRVGSFDDYVLASHSNNQVPLDENFIVQMTWSNPQFYWFRIRDLDRNWSHQLVDDAGNFVNEVEKRAFEKEYEPTQTGTITLEGRLDNAFNDAPGAGTFFQVTIDIVESTLTCTLNVDETAKAQNCSNETDDDCAYRFSASADGGDGNYDYQWDFDDGTTATGTPVYHCFDFDGDYNVQLDVFDQSGNSCSKNQIVTVSGCGAA